MNPFRRKKNNGVAEMRRRLEQAEREKRAIAEQGKAREPRLSRLQRVLADNGFADLLNDSMDRSRRRRLT